LGGSEGGIGEPACIPPNDQLHTCTPNRQPDPTAPIDTPFKCCKDSDNLSYCKPDVDFGGFCRPLSDGLPNDNRYTLNNGVCTQDVNGIYSKAECIGEGGRSCAVQNAECRDSIRHHQNIACCATDVKNICSLQYTKAGDVYGKCVPCAKVGQQNSLPNGDSFQCCDGSHPDEKGICTDSCLNRGETCLAKGEFGNYDRGQCCNGSCTTMGDGDGVCYGYSCNNGKCLLDLKGEYSSLAECQANCSEQKKYSCTNGTCSVDPNGQFSSLKACNANCSEQNKYSCTNGTCSVDPNGQFSSLKACNANCSAPPAPKGSCPGTPNQLVACTNCLAPGLPVPEGSEIGYVGNPYPSTVMNGTDATACAWVKGCEGDEECIEQCPVAVAIAFNESKFSPFAQSSDGFGRGMWQVGYAHSKTDPNDQTGSASTQGLTGAMCLGGVGSEGAVCNSDNPQNCQGGGLNASLINNDGSINYCYDAAYSVKHVIKNITANGKNWQTDGHKFWSCCAYNSKGPTQTCQNWYPRSLTNHKMGQPDTPDTENLMPNIANGIDDPNSAQNKILNSCKMAAPTGDFSKYSTTSIKGWNCTPMEIPVTYNYCLGDCSRPCPNGTNEECGGDTCWAKEFSCPPNS